NSARQRRFRAAPRNSLATAVDKFFTAVGNQKVSDAAVGRRCKGVNETWPLGGRPPCHGGRFSETRESRDNQNVRGSLRRYPGPSVLRPAKDREYDETESGDLGRTVAKTSLLRAIASEVIVVPSRRTAHQPV